MTYLTTILSRNHFYFDHEHSYLPQISNVEKAGKKTIYGHPFKIKHSISYEAFFMV